MRDFHPGYAIYGPPITPRGLRLIVEFDRVTFELRGRFARQLGREYDLLSLIGLLDNGIEVDLGFGWIECLIAAVKPAPSGTSYVRLFAKDQEAVSLAFGGREVAQ